MYAPRARGEKKSRYAKARESWCSAAARFLLSGHSCEVERREKSRRLFETDLGMYERQHRLPVTLGAERDLRLSLLGRGGGEGRKDAGNGGKNLAHYGAS